jgi:cobalt-zinc-cadmium efflux system outer membrane protein
MSISLCLRIGAVLLFFLVAPTLAHSQSVGPGPDTSGQLPENAQAALQAAWARHPTAEVASRELGAAQARARAAGQPVYNPEIEVGAERADVDTVEAGISLTLDIGGKRRARSDVGSAELAVASARYALARRDFQQQWLSAWFALGTATERAEIASRQLVLIERFADLAERQLRVGDVSTLERDLALLAREEARVQSATLMGQAAQARAAMRIAGGDSAVPPDASDVPFPEPVRIDDSTISALPEAVVAANQSLAAQARVVSATRDRRADPTVSVRGGQVDTGFDTEPVIGLTVSIPLSVRNTFSAEVDAARGDADSLAAQVRLVELELRARAQQSAEVYAALLDAWKQWQSSGASATGERAELLERLWKAGELSTSDYLVQLKQALDTALAGAELRGELRRATLDHLSAAGRLDDWTGMPPVSGDLIR